MEENKDNKAPIKKVKLLTIVESFLAIGFILFAIIAFSAYFTSPSENSIQGKILSKISYPIVAIEGKNFIYTSEIKESLAILKKFYEGDSVRKAGSRVDFSTEDGLKRLKIKEREVLNKEIENKVIVILAENRGIKVSEAEIKEYAAWKISAEGFLGESVDDFNTKYDWGIERIKNKIIIPMLYANKLRESISAEIVSDNSPKERIETAKNELEGGKEFSEVARTYSQGTSAQQGGSLGWINKEQLLPEVAAKVFSADFQSDGKHEIIESQLGYHIVNVEDMKKDSGVDSVRISQIFSKKKTLSDWLSKEMQKLDIKLLTKDYYWDKEKSIAEFTDESMRKFEKETYENSGGDPSVSQIPKM